MMIKLHSYTHDRWIAPEPPITEIASATTGKPVAQIGTTVRDFASVLDHARNVGGPALRAMTFHQRARILKALAEALMARKEELYELSWETGATRTDGWIDIEGGAGTFYAYSSKGRRELPDVTLVTEGAVEPLSKRGTFIGQHVLTPLQGTAVHINAFNFPVWGMLEKLAPTLLAGMPAIVKPATASAWLTEAVFRAMIESRIFPDGAIQLVCGSAGDLMGHLDGQCAVAFTGSASTGHMLKTGKAII